MKKYTFVLILFILPSIALASWWNPFSWKIFNSKESQTIINTTPQNTSSEEIQKLKEEISNLKKQKPVSSYNTPIKISESPKNIVKENIPIVAKENILRISNINKKIEKGKVTLSWDTNLPSDSRLILDNGNGKVYESENGFGVNHLVKIFNTESSKEYDYKITATTADKKSYDDHYGSFIAFIEYKVYLGSNDTDCQTIKITDTAGRVITGKEIEVRGILNSSTGIIYKSSVKKNSDSNGEVRYCDKVNIYEINGEGISATLKSTQQTQQSNYSFCTGISCVSA